MDFYTVRMETLEQKFPAGRFELCVPIGGVSCPTAAH